MNRNFEWGVVIATFLFFFLAMVPRRYARLTYFFHPKLRKIHAVLITLKLITRTLRSLLRAASTPIANAEDAFERGWF